MTNSLDRWSGRNELIESFRNVLLSIYLVGDLERQRMNLQKSMTSTKEAKGKIHASGMCLRLWRERPDPEKALLTPNLEVKMSV